MVQAITNRLPASRRWIAAFAALCYVPLLLTDPGRVHADTKSYLYLDPGRLLAGARSMWDPEIGLGTTSHQTIGYLFPLGPYYWVTEELLHLPAWIAQRLYFGTLLLAAGLGFRYLCRVLGVRGVGVGIGMLTFAFSPYALQYSARLSVLLSPWAALGWLTGFTVLALRGRSWRYPALIALTIQCIGSVNATALLLALVGPVLWIPYAWFAARETDGPRVWSAAWRSALLTSLTSLWWVSGLWVEGRYGLNILRFTESIQTVSATAFPFEIVRGLGYWFFYGRDRIGPWNEAFRVYSLQAVVIFASLALPALALAGGATRRWRHRAYFQLLIVVGVAIAVGAAPYDDPSIVGSVFKSFATTSTVGFALRSTARAVPLVVLGVSMLLAVGVSAWWDWLQARGRTRLAPIVVVAIGALTIVNAPGLWHGDYYSDYLGRDEEVPGYWTEALAALDAKPHTTRVLALPGADFAAYRWGDTVDPIEPGLMDRAYVARELVPWGSEATTNLLVALDRRLQEGVLDPDAVAPIARLMGVGDVLLRFDLETDRFTLIPAGPLWQTFTDHGTPRGIPEGLGPLTTYGDEIPGSLTFPELGDLARDPSLDPDPPPVAVLEVEHALPIVRVKSAADPIVVAGDGESLVDLAAAGLLDADRAVLYSAAVGEDLADLPDGALLVLTDGNRRRGMRWAGLNNNYGYTEEAGEQALVEDLLDQRLDVFPGSGDDARTVVELDGVASLRASRYGTASFGYSPGERPSVVFDGDLETAWTVDAGDDLTHQWLRLELDAPITTDHINVVQPKGKQRKRFLTEVSLRFDDGDPVAVTLDRSSRTPTGQDLAFERTTFRTLEIRMEDVNAQGSLYVGTRNSIGFAEVRIADEEADTPVTLREVTRLPRDLLERAPEGGAGRALAIVLSRDLTMDGTELARRFDLPAARSFGVSGVLELGPFAESEDIDRALGIADATDGGVTVAATSRLGDPIARASSAVDADPTTAWVTEISDAKDATISVTLPERETIDRLDLQVVADGRHSVPSRIELSADGGPPRVIEIDPIAKSAGVDGPVAVPLEFEPLTGTTFELTITGVRPVKRSTIVMPVGLAELGLGSARRSELPAELDGACRRDLVEVDGQSLGIRLTGTTADALRQRRIPFVACDGELTLDAGGHEIASVMNPKSAAGFDVEQIVLLSDARGDGTTTAAVTDDDTGGARGAAVEIVDESRTALSMRLTPSTEARWLVLGQSINAGWHARIDGTDLGPAQLVDGYANGWLIPGSAGTEPVRVELEWEPQRVVAVAVGTSALAVLACLAIVLRTRRRRTPVAGTDTIAERATIAVAERAHVTIARVVASIAVAGVAAVMVRPWVGAIIGVFAIVALRARWGRLAVRWLPALILGGIAITMSVGQIVRNLPPRFDWPSQWDGLRIPTWIALFVLALDAAHALVEPNRDAGVAPETEDS